MGKTLVKLVLNEDGSITTFIDTDTRTLGYAVATLQAEFNKRYWEHITKYEVGTSEPY